jgi:hypothetical protein
MAHASTGRMAARAKRERSLGSSFAGLLVSWADEDIGSFDGGVYVTSDPI